MKPIMITNLLEFLEYMAKTELGPASGLPYYNVTFTVPEIRAAVRDMTEGGVLYLRFQRELTGPRNRWEEKCKRLCPFGCGIFSDSQ